MTSKTPEKQPPAPKSQHGGKRAGAGRKHRKGPDTPTDSALAYLEAVACGAIEGDSLRVAAAKAVMPFQAPRQRAPVKGIAPSAARQSEAANAESAQSEAWALTVQKIRSKHGGAKA